MSTQTDESNILIDFFYYKNTPLQKEFFAKLRELFWKLIKQAIDAFAV